MFERWKGEIKSDLYHCCSGLASHGRLLGSVYLLSVEVSSFCWWPTMAGRGCVFTGILLPAAVHSERSSNGEGLSVALYARHLVLMWHAIAMFHSCCLSVASIFKFFFFTCYNVCCFPLTRFLSCSSSFSYHHSYCHYTFKILSKHSSHYHCRTRCFLLLFPLVICLSFHHSSTPLFHVCFIWTRGTR